MISSVTDLSIAPTRRRRRFIRRGISLVWITIILFVIAGMVGLAIDVGYVRVVSHQLQNAADAAALAAAHDIWRTSQDEVPPALATALSIAGQNKAASIPVQLLSSDVIIGRYDATNPQQPIPADDEWPNAVQVTARHATNSPHGPHALLFGPVFGVSTLDISRTAVAVKQHSPGQYPILFLNHNKPKSLQLGGSMALRIDDGGIAVNSTAGNAVYIHGSSGLELDAEAISTMGSVQDRGGFEFDGRIEQLDDFLADPLADLEEPDPIALGLTPEPAPDLSSGRTARITDATASPDGYHYLPDGIAMNNGQLELSPGVYILGGQGLQVNGGTLIGHGVMLYVKQGQIDLKGNGVIDITPPALAAEDAARYFPAADTYHGISFWQSRDNTKTVSIHGNENTSLSGTLYFPGAEFYGRGCGDMLGNQLIADSGDIQGTGDITMHFRTPDDLFTHWSYLVR